MPLLLCTCLIGGCSTLQALFPPKDDAPDAAANRDVGAPAMPAEPAAPPVDPADDLPIDPVPKATIVAVQAALVQRGFAAGVPDGKVGGRTVRAIRLFKLARRMPVDGTVTPRLLDELAVPR